MEFKLPYAQAMRQQAPKMFNQLCRSGQFEAHLQAKSHEAHAMLKEILAQAPLDKYGKPTMQAEREAEEQVFAAMLDFPPEQKQLRERPEPPDDLLADA